MVVGNGTPGEVVGGRDEVGWGTPGDVVGGRDEVGWGTPGDVVGGRDDVGWGLDAVGTTVGGTDTVGGAVVGREPPGTGSGGSVHGTSTLQVGAGEGATVGGVTVADGLGLGAGPPSANALVAATVPRPAMPTAAAAMRKTRFTGFKRIRWLQTGRGPGGGAFARTDVSARKRLSMAL